MFLCVNFVNDTLPKTNIVPPYVSFRECSEYDLHDFTKILIVLEVVAECSAITTVAIGLPVGWNFCRLLFGSGAGNGAKESPTWFPNASEVMWWVHFT